MRKARTKKTAADYISTFEAAQILGVGADTVRLWSRMGRLAPAPARNTP